ncbi:SUKH-4 family immunity protein [Streptomyces sp. NPDC004830]
MRTTDAGSVTITLTGAGMDPWVAHPPARHWLGLVADPAGDLGGLLPPGPREHVLTGRLPVPGGPVTESVLPAGATGGASAHFLHDHPALPDSRPLAPSLRTLVRFAEATDELAGLRAQFASCVGRHGPAAVAEASRLLLSAFRDGDDGAPGPFQAMAPLIRPLSLTAGRDGRSGLSLDLPHRLLDQAFGPRRVVRFEDVDLPAALTHEPTRRFLREVGLPEEAHAFSLDTDTPPATPAEYHADCPDPACPPAGAARLIRLGHLPGGHSLLLDGGTGAVLHADGTQSALRPLSTDVSTLAFTLWLLHRERTPDGRARSEPDTGVQDQLAMTMLQVLAAADPASGTAGVL